MKIPREERMNMSTDELLRAVWLLDDCVDAWG